MPPQHGVGSDDRRNLTERLPSQTIGARGESPPVVISEPQAPPTQLPPQKAVLLDQVSDHLPLAALQPAGEDQEQQLEGRDVDHGGSL
jgi:hypothetical protein